MKHKFTYHAAGMYDILTTVVFENIGPRKQRMAKEE